MQEIIYRALDLQELNRIAEIDRAENIFEAYVYKNGQLVIEQVNDIVTSFEPAELDSIIEKQQQIKLGGGEVIGAFKEGAILGVGSIENKKRGLQLEYCKMDILYVSNASRGKRIGHNLIQEIKKIAGNFNARKLYISATPTKATVDFYVKEGARLAQEIDQELFDLEPLDIHLEMDI